MDERLEVVLKGTEFKRFQDQVYEKIREQYGMKKIEVEVLYALSKDEASSTPTAVAKRYKLNRGHVSQAIDALSRRGLVQAVPDKEDRRSIHYYPTEGAKPMVEDILRTHRSLCEMSLSGVDEEEIRVFLTIAEKIFANIRDIFEEE